MIPCDHIEADTKHFYSHVIYSDDRGQTWRLGARTPRHHFNECEVVELPDGRIACLYEAGLRHPYELILFAAFELEEP